MFPGVVVPRFAAELAAPRRRVKGPAELAGPHVVAPDVTGLEAGLRADAGRADDDDVADDDRRRRPAVGLGGVIVVDAQVDLTAGAEIRVALSGLRIQRYEPMPDDADHARVAAVGPVA